MFLAIGLRHLGFVKDGVILSSSIAINVALPFFLSNKFCFDTSSSFSDFPIGCFFLSFIPSFSLLSLSSFTASFSGKKAYQIGHSREGLVVTGKECINCMIVGTTLPFLVLQYIEQNGEWFHCRSFFLYATCRCWVRAPWYLQWSSVRYRVWRLHQAVMALRWN